MSEEKAGVTQNEKVVTVEKFHWSDLYKQEDWLAVWIHRYCNFCNCSCSRCSESWSRRNLVQTSKVHSRFLCCFFSCIIYRKTIGWLFER